MKLGQVSQRQMAIIVAFFIFGSVFITLPRGLSKAANHTGWLSIIMAMLAFAAYAWLLSRIVNKMDSSDLVGYCHQLFGRVVGRVFTALFILLPMMMFSAFVVRIVTDLLVTIILPETPMELMIGMFLLLRYWLASGGIRMIGRYGELVMPLIVLVLGILLGMSFLTAEKTRILPLFDADFLQILEGGLIVLSTYMEAGIILFFGHQLRDKQKTFRTLMIINIWVGVMFMVVYWATLSNFGTSFTRRMAFPLVEVIRDIQLANFIEHLEAIFLAVLVFLNMSKGAMSYYASCVGWQSWFGLKDYRFVRIPTLIIIYYLAMLPQNLLQSVFRFEQFKSQIYPYFGGIFLVVLGVLSYSRKKKGAAQ